MQKKWAVFASAAIIVAVMGVFVFWRQPTESHSEASVPVIVTQAEVIGQGVHVAWLKAPAGSKVINGYIIERSRNDKEFTEIAHVEKESLQHLDAEGRNGDRYRIITKGDQHSKPSEPITAAFPKPGSNIRFASLPSSHVLGFTVPNNQSVVPEGQASQLGPSIDTAFVRLDAAVADHNFAEVASYLHALQKYQHESLLLLPKLSSAEKLSLAQACARHTTTLKTSLFILSEQSQMDGMLVKAGCDAIQEAAR